MEGKNCRASLTGITTSDFLGNFACRIWNARRVQMWATQGRVIYFIWILFSHSGAIPRVWGKIENVISERWEKRSEGPHDLASHFTNSPQVPWVVADRTSFQRRCRFPLEKNSTAQDAGDEDTARRYRWDKWSRINDRWRTRFAFIPTIIEISVVPYTGTCSICACLLETLS